MRVCKESYNSSRSPVMKTLDKSVETVGLESMVTFLVASGADEFEHATPLYSCHGVFIDRFFLGRISQE